MSSEAKLPAPNRKLFITTVTIGILILASLLLDAHLIRREAGGKALWNSQEAYFFIASSSRGVRVKWLGYPLLVFGELLGRIEPASDKRGDLHVVHVTTKGVEIHVVNLPDRSPGSGPNSYTPIEGRIWANYPAIGGLCWWTGNHFEPAKQEERQRIDHFSDLKHGSFEDLNGWSSLGIGGPTMRFHLKPNIGLLVFGGPEPNSGPLSIQLSTNHQLSVPIYSVQQSVGLVSPSEYRRTFQSPSLASPSNP